MKIKYVQLESEAFLTDLDYITMSHAVNFRTFLNRYEKL